MNKWLLVPLLIGVVMVPLLLKAWYVDDFIFHYTNTRLLGVVLVLVNDAPIYALLIGLLFCSYLPPLPIALAAVLRLLALAIFAVYLVDLYVIVNFNTHLTLNDIIKYIGYSGDYLDQIYGLKSIGLLAIGGLLSALLLAYLLSPFKLADWRGYRMPLLALTLLPLLAAFADNDQYAHSWVYRNVFDYNLTILSESAPYSDDFVSRAQIGLSPDCQPVAAAGKDIIILMVESLSSYQSRFFSGIEDWTPNLDAIARQNLAFTRFYANGFITEDGEIALLTGLLPIYPPASYNDDGGVSFASFYAVEQSLPKRLKPLGFRSEFLTSADLDFGNTEVWARSIGFDYVEGHEHPDYQGWPRFQFKAAPDRALYRRALDRLQQPRSGPLLLFIKTVSTHHPYLNPENGHRSEAEVFQYADRELAEFYRQLQARKFFDHGLLLIVGDHHAMAPLKPMETQRFGHYPAAAMVPLVAVGQGLPAAVESRPFQQTDVFNTLQGLAGGQQCRDDWHGILWGDHAVPPRFIAHRRGDNRDKISIFSEQDDYLIKLDGDATRLVSQKPESPALRQALVDYVNGLRITRAAWAKRERSAERSD